MTSKAKSISISVANNAAEFTAVCEQVLAKARKNHYTKDDIFAIHLALEEAFINAGKHGNKSDPTKTIKIEYQITSEKFDVLITDQGTGFNPDNVPDPRCGKNLYKPSGRGVLLMKSYMDFVEYNKTGNAVRMIKYRGKPFENVKLKNTDNCC